MSGTSSGTYNFLLSNSLIVIEAFDRIGITPPMLNRHHIISARTSLNLELLDWSNRGFNFWETISGTINLVAGQGAYTMPANLVTVTEVWYSNVNAFGSGINQDRFLIPMTRTEYSQITNKNSPGIPTRYWYQMLIAPQMTIWQVPLAGQVAPNFVLNWYGLNQIQDAGVAGGEVPNIHYRAVDALVAGLTLRLAEKFGPKDPMARQAMMLEKKTIADKAWLDLTYRDQEPGVIRISPNIWVYGRMT